MPPVPPVPSIRQHGQGSAPPSPYGHPKATAVASGAGLGRQVLPSISQWDDDVNPMFRVVSPPLGLRVSLLMPSHPLSKVEMERHYLLSQL
jgi:hypothetical protein